jgi:hypothetical protein
LSSFSRRVGVEFFGDAASLEKTYAQVGVATKQFGDLSVSTNTKVTESVLAGTTKRIQATRASVAEYQIASESFVKGSDAQIAATYQLGIAQKRLAVLTGETAVATTAFSGKSKTAERDVGKTARGLLAGSGAAASLGRSLAFASTGFIAFAAGATLIRGSIKAAQDEVVAQKQVAQQLRTSGKSWSEYGTQISAALLKESHLAGFTKSELLTSFGFLVRIGGNVQKSLKLTGLAADIARARTISLQSASLALAKALGGSATALRRLGIIVPKHVTTTQALAFVTAKFAGQAKAGTTATEKFHAALVDSGAAIGRDLLPSFNRLLTSLSNWLAKMNETGRLQKDVADVTKVLGEAFHVLGQIIRGVDKITGSFKTTLEVLLSVYTVSKIATLSTAVGGLAAKWGLVATAAGEAAAAQTGALAESGAAGGGAAAGAEGRAALGGLSNANIAAIVAAVSVIILNSNAYKNLQNRAKSDLGPFGFLVSNAKDLGKSFVNAAKNAVTAADSILGNRTGGPILPGPATGSDSPNRGGLARPLAIAPGTTGKPPIIQWAQFQLRIADQIAQAQASLTKTTTDDVAAAKAIIAHIKRAIASGHLHGATLVAAIQAEAGAISTIQSAAQAAAQKAQAAAAKALAAASTFNVPEALQLADAKLQAFGKSETAVLHQIIAAAEKAIHSGKKNTQGLIAAYNAIASARQQLASGSNLFTIPAKLTLALAKEQALGLPTTATLQAMKKAILKYLHSAKRSIAQQTDAYNQLASINQQIGQGITSALGGFKQASTKALTKGLGLTPAQRRALRARLSQLGPGGTIPGTGVGAAGFIIGTDGRPLVVHTHINIDGKRVADNTTRHQHRHRRRNPSQRRGPNAGG